MLGMTLVPTLPQLLRLVRSDHSLTRTQLAQGLGVSARTLEGWEAGRPPPQPAVLRFALERLIFQEPSASLFGPALVHEEALAQMKPPR
jgi:transcriptional regulator with XRE-family HTH domain